MRLERRWQRRIHLGPLLAHSWQSKGRCHRFVSAVPPGAGESATGVHNFDAHEGPLTDFAWEVWPDGFHDLVFRISREYKTTPLEITGNGCSYLDCPDEHGRQRSRLSPLQPARRFRMG